ncbi:MAG: hypothetical protein QM530_09380 [Phycisphaerales bacterium]|nr:hypothetical protein [Phycisphaerales bacterium]
MNERIAKIEQFLIGNPNDLFLHHALALEYIKLGEEEKAKHYFEHNLNVDPNYIATYYHLAKLLERIGNTERALTIYQDGMNIAKAMKEQHAYNELQAAYEDLAEL